MIGILSNSEASWLEKLDKFCYQGDMLRECGRVIIFIVFIGYYGVGDVWCQQWQQLYWRNIINNIE